MTQKARVKKMLEDAGLKGVSSKTFIESFLPRAAARVQELKDEGEKITSEREGRFVRYRLVRATVYGYCRCGCGEKTKLATQTKTATGEVKGEPRRWLVGHHRRKTEKPYRIDPETGCWIWMMNRDRLGYGSRWKDGRHHKAHRLIYEELRGPISPGVDLDHLCRNPSCVNPDHLEPVSHAENVRRGARAKLSEQQAREIRAAEGTNVEIAKRFGVHKDTVRDVRNGRTWKNLVGVGGSTVVRDHVEAPVYPADSSGGETLFEIDPPSAYDRFQRPREVPELPYVNFYCSDWLGDSKVRLMPLEARALHIDLLCHAWNLGRIPADTAAISRLLGVDIRKFKALWKALEPCWQEDGNGGIFNKRLEAERQKQRKKRGQDGDQNG